MIPAATMPVRHRLGCTWLITPATASDRCAVAMRAGADVTVVDLEDSVPDHAKDAARTAALQFLSTSAPGQCRPPVLGVRVNALSTAHGLKDLVAIADGDIGPAVVLLPKVESPRDIDLAATVINADHRGISVWALIETPRAIQRLPEILRADAAAGVVFGAADYAASAGCRRTRQALLYPRAALAVAAAAAGLLAVDSPFFDLDDRDGLLQEAEEARDLGFTGKGAIHPAQLATIQAAFTPSAQELADAAAVVAAADRTGDVITTVNGRMVGPPLVAAARLLTAQAADRHPASEES